MNGTGHPAEDLRQDIAGDRINQWAELYALNAVSDAERNTIDEYISAASEDTYHEFLNRMHQARETITSVYATYQTDPPAGLWPRILQQVLSGQDRAGASSATGPDFVGTGRADGTDDLAGRRRIKANRTPATREWIVGAAAAAVLAVGSVTVAQDLEEPSLREQVVLASDVDSTTVEIRAGGVAEIKRSESLNAAIVTLPNLPAPQSGKVYQMWRLPEDGSAPESLGTMTGEEAAETKTTVVQGIEPYSALAITVEPEGGSKTPTMPIVAHVPLEA